MFSIPLGTMETIFIKKLTPSEKTRHWVIIPRKIRNIFPDNNVNFNIKAGKKVSTVRIDSLNRLFLGSRVVGDLDLDSPNACILIRRAPNGEFIVSRKELF